MSRPASAGVTPVRPAFRAAALAGAGLLCCLLTLYLPPPSGLALTLERPNVNVDWSRLPERKERPKLVYSPKRLFGTVEFRGPLKNLPQWERILALYGEGKSLDPDFSGAQRTAWDQLKKGAGALPPLDLLREVNKFFNRWPYRNDLDVYGLVDYWATPAEFIKNSGDCEDYAVAKMFALIQLGFDPAKLRLVLLKDQIRNVDHAVLAAYLDGEVYILDSTSPLVLPHSKYGHYRPVLSVNLFYRWAHVPPAK